MSIRMILSFLFVLLVSNVAIAEQKRSACGNYSYEGLVDPCVVKQEWKLVYSEIESEVFADAYYLNGDLEAAVRKCALRFYRGGYIIGFVYEHKGVLRAFAYEPKSRCYISVIPPGETMQAWQQAFKEYFSQSLEET